MAFNILYLDDEADLLQVFEDFFSTPELCVRTYADVEKALQAIELEKPDLIFLDFRLPGITGHEVAKRIPHSIPIALISGDLEVAQNERIAKVFEKPFDFEDVEAFIHSMMKK